MTVSYKVANPIEEFILDVTDSAFDFLKPLKRLPSLISWVLVLLISTFFGFIYTLVFYLPIMFARRKTDILLDSLIDDINDIAEQEAMDLHLDIESLRKRMSTILSKGSRFFAIDPIMQEMKKMEVKLLLAEKVLYLKAYPENERPLTEDESKELYNLMSGWREDEKLNMETY